MEIYSTLTRSKETFETMNDNRINLFVCGPTVYDDAHIGHGRTYISFDTIKRYWEYKGYTVFYIQNITDVDDKIIKRSKETGIPAGDIARKFEKRYIEDMNKLNVTGVNLFARATDHMGEIIDQIQRLIDKGFAYETEDGVYFGIDNFEEFGKLSNRNIEELESHREIAKTTKKNPIDFALWKKRENVDEPVWNSPWGEGRPGWHIECVVMINNNMGDMIDIHGGGMDLKFPHHENEAAQQECTHHNALANFWVHNAMINIDGQKMSKSLGNTLWAKDIVEKLGTNLTRWLMSSVHYRKELNFSEETVETARKELDKVLNPLRQVDIKSQLASVSFDGYDEESYRSFLDQLDDDLNTPNAYTVIFDTVKKINQGLRTKEPDWNTVIGLRNSVVKMLSVLGIVVDRVVLDEEDKTLFTKWNEAKANKDWDGADQYRNALIAKGLM